MATGTYMSIITLNVNGLNAPTKRQTGWMDTKQDAYICCLQETHFISQKEKHQYSILTHIYGI